MLSTNTYRDNNNYIQYNNVKTEDNRYWFLDPEKEYTFVNYEQLPTWTSANSVSWMYNTTYDLKTYKVEPHTLLFGSYFFYSSVKIEHHRIAMNYMGVFAEFGGLQAILMSLLSLLGLLVNNKLLQG